MQGSRCEPWTSSKSVTPSVTQFGRAPYELNVDTWCANSSQAKGRVERANLTLQDRLVKELRLRNIDTREAANAYAPHFIADFNGRSARRPGAGPMRTGRSETMRISIRS